MVQVSAVHWATAIVASVALHATLLIQLLDTPDDGATAAGTGGHTLAITLVAGRAGEEADSVRQEAVAPADAPLPEPESAATPEIETAPTAQPPIAPEPVLAPPVAAAPVAQPLPEIAPVLPTPIEATTPPVPLPAIAETVPSLPARPQPKPSPPESPRPQAAPTRPEAEPPAPAAQAASRASTRAAGESPGDTPTHASDTRTIAGGGPVGTPSDTYMNRLRYWLERNKTYPKDARRQRMQGIVQLYFRVTRDGRVLDHRIHASSGYVLLDGEAEAMLQRAQPLPEFTDSMKGGYLDVVVPVSFSLRGNR